MATLADVARRAGVSLATASRSLSGAGPASQQTHDRVRAAAAELGYAAHPVARMLARGTGTRIVLAMRHRDPAILADQFVSRAAAAVAGVADAAGLGVALRRLPLDCGPALDEIAGDRSVAALLLAGHDRATLGAVPARLRGRTAAIGVGGTDVDSAAGIGALLRHLHGRGRRRIALVAGPRWLGSSRLPLGAYVAFAGEAGFPVRTVAGDFTATRGRSAGRRILREWPETDAIVAVGDAAALGVLDALARQGVRVPDDVAVTGFDDIPFAGLARPALTTATHPVERIAAAATRAALDGDHGERLFPSRPVVRESCGGSASTA